MRQCTNALTRQPANPPNIQCPKNPFLLQTNTIIETLRQNQDFLRERFGIQSLVLFGSFARNQQRQDSDLDIQYRLVPGSRMPLMRLQTLEKYLGNLLDLPKIELVPGNHTEPIIDNSIQKDGIVVF